MTDRLTQIAGEFLAASAAAVLDARLQRNAVPASSALASASAPGGRAWVSWRRAPFF